MRFRCVQRNPCGDAHSFRKPRGDVEEDVPEPIAAKKRAMMKKPTFDEFFAKHSDKNAKPYEFREHYHENAIVTHPKFGRGFVSEIVSDSKVEVTFKDAKRVLVHNRKNMPGLPLAAEGDGVASNSKIGKKLKKEAKEAATATKKPVVRTQAPAAKAPKRTAKPARSVRVASGKRAAKVAKRPAKVAKRKK